MKKKYLMMLGVLFFIGCGSSTQDIQIANNHFGPIGPKPQNSIDESMSKSVYELAQKDGVYTVVGFDSTPLHVEKIVKPVTITKVVEGTDSDRDGVIDIKDKCPNTPSDLTVNPEGCPVLDRLHIIFDSGSWKVKKIYYPRIKKVAEILRSNPNLKIEIDGYTDDRGSRDFNRVLSKKRAEAVKEVLVKTFHIDPKRIITKGYGPDYPLVPNTNETNRALNRRVEIVALNKIITTSDKKVDSIQSIKKEKKVVSKPIVTTEGTIINDSDFDGIPDSIDLCPNTKSENVNQTGCPILFSFHIRPNIKPLKESVKNTYEKEIKKIVDYLKSHPNVKIEIDAFTDNSGTQTYRLSFSQKIADAIKNVLVEDYGIDKQRVVSKGLADAFPVVPNTTPQNKLKNFRVEVIKIGTIKKYKSTKPKNVLNTTINVTSDKKTKKIEKKAPKADKPKEKSTSKIATEVLNAIVK